MVWDVDWKVRNKMNCNKPIEVKSDQPGCKTEWFDAKHDGIWKGTDIIYIGSDRFAIYLPENDYCVDAYGNRWLIRNKQGTVTIYEWKDTFGQIIWSDKEPMQKLNLSMTFKDVSYSKSYEWNKTGKSKEIEIDN